jgi:hypothetical protein
MHDIARFEDRLLPNNIFSERLMLAASEAASASSNVNDPSIYNSGRRESKTWSFRAYQLPMCALKMAKPFRIS